MQEDYIKSIVRTNNLHCSGCLNPIKKGNIATFKIINNEMDKVFCEICGEDYIGEVIDSQVHPFSSEALGQ